MLLNQRERTVLHAILLRGQAPAKEIAKATDLPEHIVRKDIQDMQKKGIISPYTLINQFKFGWMKVGVHFSFCSSDSEKINQAIHLLQAYENIISIIEVFGRYQYFMSLIVRDINELDLFLQKIHEDIPGLQIKYDLSFRLKISLFKRKYLSSDSTATTCLSQQSSNSPLDIDDTALSVLNCINALGGFPNASAISEATGIPHSTVHTKIKSLETKGVIVGYSYNLAPHKINYMPYDVLIRTSTNSVSFKKDFFDYCLKHSYIVGLAECAGHWQFEIRIEVPSPSDANNVSKEILHIFRNDIYEVDAVSICREIKYMHTPIVSSLHSTKRHNKIKEIRAISKSAAANAITPQRKTRKGK